MPASADGKAILVKVGKYTYKIVAPAVLIPGREGTPHGGEWEAVVTI